MTKRNRIKMARTTIAAKNDFQLLTVVVFRWLGLSLTGDLIPRVGIVFKPFSYCTIALRTFQVLFCGEASAVGYTFTA